jgi:transposase-like protein
VAARWTYLYRAVEQYGQVIDVLLSVRRDLAAARRFFTRALRAGTVPVEVTTDRAAAHPRVLDEFIPSALHTTERYANNRIEADHGRLKARLRPMRADQCVIPSRAGGRPSFTSVATTTSASLISGGRPERGSSSRPLIPPCW